MPKLLGFARFVKVLTPPEFNYYCCLCKTGLMFLIFEVDIVLIEGYCCYCMLRAISLDAVLLFMSYFCC